MTTPQDRLTIEGLRQTVADLLLDVADREEALVMVRAAVVNQREEIAALRAALDAGATLLGYMDYGRMRVGGDEANRAYLAAWRAARAALATAKETP